MNITCNSCQLALTSTLHSDHTDVFVYLTVQACLGTDAKDEERNVVQITAENDEGEPVKHTILSLRVGGTEQVNRIVLV